MGIEAISSTGSASNYGTKDVRSAQSVEPAKVADVAATNPTQDFSTVVPAGKSGAGYGAQGNGSKPSESTIKQAISDINKKINPNTVAQYGFHEDTNRVTIKIVDKDTDDLIKEYPAEETLDMIAKVWELAGMFVDEKG